MELLNDNRLPFLHPHHRAEGSMIRSRDHRVRENEGHELSRHVHVLIDPSLDLILSCSSLTLPTCRREPLLLLRIAGRSRENGAPILRYSPAMFFAFSPVNYLVASLEARPGWLPALGGQVPPQLETCWRLRTSDFCLLQYSVPSTSTWLPAWCRPS